MILAGLSFDSDAIAGVSIMKTQENRKVIRRKFFAPVILSPGSICSGR
jgi:hypothetical protein